MRKISYMLLSAAIICVVGCERESRPATEQLESSLPRATADDAAIVEPQADPDKAVVPVVEAATEPEAIPTKQEMIEKSTVVSEPKDIPHQSEVTKGFALSEDDQKVLEAFAATAGMWIQQARLADMGRRNSAGPIVVDLTVIEGDEESQFAQGLKLLESLAERVRALAEMNRRKQEILSSAKITNWIVDRISDGQQIHSRVRELLRDVQSLKVTESRVQGSFVSAGREKIASGTVTKEDVEELARMIQEELISLGDSRLIEMQIDEGFAYFPAPLLDEFGLNKEFDTTLAVKRSERAAYLLQFVTEYYTRGAFSTWLHGQEKSKKTVRQYVNDQFEELVDDIESRQSREENKFVKRVVKFEFRNPAYTAPDLTIEEVTKNEEQMVRLTAISGGKLGLKGYPVQKLSMVQQRLELIQKRQQSIWDQGVDAGLEAVMTVVEKDLRKHDSDFIKEALESAAKGESHTEVPRAALQYSLWEEEEHDGKYLAAAVRIVQAKFKPVWEVEARMPEEFLTLFRSKRDEYIWSRIAAEEGALNDEKKRLELEIEELIAKQQFDSAVAGMSRLLEIEGWNAARCLERARIQLKSGGLEECEKNLTALIAGGEILNESLYLRAICRYRMGRYADAVADAWSLHLPEAMNGTESESKLLLAADMLACSPHQEIRNPEAAVGIAQSICERQRWRIAASMECLARALAESGRFAEAEKVLGDIRERSPSTEEVQEQLRSRKPIRMEF